MITFRSSTVLESKLEQELAHRPPALNSLGLAGRPQDCRIVVAMSGGVDSSVTAALLAREGYDVVGLTLQLYDHGVAVQKKGACCAGQDIHDARRVADALDIPHFVLDYESRFSESVMEEFADSYLRGETPIPCVRCNERVKFKDMLETARELGGLAMATGHYIQRKEGANGAELHRAIDPERDQSYFLFSTTPKQLDYLRFPLGGMTKDAVRDVARDLGLEIAEKPDSQDICFVPQGRYTSVVERLRPGASDPGDIVHLDGPGDRPAMTASINYTIGQRRGLGVAVGDPLFVVKIDAAAKQVVVGPREALATRRIALREINWLGEGTLEQAARAHMAVDVKVRSTRPPEPAQLVWTDAGAAVELQEPEYGVSPGQACVFYDPATDDSRVLGGGWISGTTSACAV